MKYINGEFIPEGKAEQANYDANVALTNSKSNTKAAPVKSKDDIENEEALKYVSQTPEEREAAEIDKLPDDQKQFVKDNQGIAGSLRVGAESFANQALLGIPEEIYKNVADSGDVAQHEALKHFHQAANAVGGVAGALGSLAIGGPLFKAASEAGRLAQGAVLGDEAVQGVSFARALASRAVGGAAEGAVIGAPKAVADAVFGDPKEAAENLLVSAGIGGLIGPAAFAVKKTAGLVGSAGSTITGNIDAKLSSYIKDPAPELALFGDVNKATMKGAELTDVGREKIQQLISGNIRSYGRFIGLGTGGPAGYIQGAAIGAIAKEAAKTIPDEYLTIGLQATLKANLFAKTQLDKIPGILDTLSTGSFGRAVKAAPTVYGLMGKDIANQESEYKSFKALSNKLASNTATQNDQQIIGHNAAGLSHNTDVQSQYSQSALNSLNYIQTIIPKNPNPILAFSKNKWQPSPGQLQDFHSQLQIINDPYHVLNKLHDGTLTQNDMDTMRAVYPAITDKITQAIMSQAANEKYQDMPYSAKSKLSLLTQMPIDQSFEPKFINAMQANFQDAQASQSGDQQTSSSSKGSLKSLDKFNTGQQEINNISAGMIGKG